MEKSIMPKGEFQKVAPAFMRNEKQYFYLRILSKEVGKDIEFVEELFDHEPTKVDEDALFASFLAKEKREVVSKIEGHAKSEAVKVFEINSVRGWLDSEERGSIRRAASDKAAEGRDVFTLYLSGNGIQMTPAKVEEILKAVEVYASDCHDKTEDHKAAVEVLTDPDEVQSYDYTAGYPEVLSFEV